MKTFFLLIVLTQNGAGDINAAFVNTQTLEQCQQKALLVESVFSASDIPVLESRCIESPLRFSEFGHASSSSKINNFYLIHLDEKGVEITKTPDWYSCMEQQKNALKPANVFCSSSVQSLQ